MSVEPKVYHLGELSHPLIGIQDLKSCILSGTADISQSSLPPFTLNTPSGPTSILLSWKRKSRGRLIVSQKNRLKLKWDTMISLLIAFSAIDTCFYISFSSRGFAQYVVDISMWSLFLVDLILNFITDYQDRDGQVVTKYSSIAKRYICGWFLIDIIALTPLMFFGYSLYQNYLQLLRILKITRSFDLINGDWIESILRACLGSSEIDKIYIKQFSRYLVLITRLLVFMAFFTFVIGAAFFWYCREMNNQSDSFENLFNDKNPSDFEKMLNCWYFAITTLTTIGYGDLHPVTAEQRGFVIVELLIGLIIFSVVIAEFKEAIDAIESFSSSKSLANEMNAWVRECEDFSRHIPARLRRMICNHFEHFWKRDRLGSLAIRWWQCTSEAEFTQSPHKFFASLPSYEKKSILQHLFKDLFDRYPRFFLIDGGLRYDLALHLQPRGYREGQTILREGRIAQEIVLFSSGSINCGLKRQRQFASFFSTSTAIIGDFEILLNIHSLFTYSVGNTLRGQTAEAFIIPAKPFKIIVKKDPKLLKRMKAFALIRIRKIVNAIQDFQPDDFLPVRLSESMLELQKSVLTLNISTIVPEETESELQSQLSAMEREKADMTESYERRRRELITAISDQMKLLNSLAAEALPTLTKTV